VTVSVVWSVLSSPEARQCRQWEMETGVSEKHAVEIFGIQGRDMRPPPNSTGNHLLHSALSWNWSRM